MRLDFPTLTTFNSILSLGEEEEIELGPVQARFPERWQICVGQICGMGDGAAMRILVTKPGITELLHGLPRMAEHNQL